MTRVRGVPVGFGRPGHRRGTSPSWRLRSRRSADQHDSGAVTVEAAVSLLALVVVLIALVWCFGLLIAQLTLGEAARAAARVAARGEGSAAVVQEARRLVPESDVVVRIDGEHVLVEVQRSVRPPGRLAAWGTVKLGARAVAALEPTS